MCPPPNLTPIRRSRALEPRFGGEAAPATFPSLSRDGSSHAWRHRTAAEDEAVHRAEHRQRRDANEVQARHGRLERTAQEWHPLLILDRRSHGRADHREPVDIHLVARPEHQVVGSDPRAVGEGEVDSPVLHLEGADALPFMDRDLVRDSFPQPVRCPGAGVPSKRAVLPVPREAVEEERDMLEDPVLPARTDPGVGRPNLLEHAPLAHPVLLEPHDRTSRYEVHGRPDLVQEGGILDRALASPDDHDALAPERFEVAELARMQYESGRKAPELLWPMGVVPDSDRQHDGGALDPTPVRERKEEAPVRMVDRCHVCLVDVRDRMALEPEGILQKGLERDRIAGLLP